MKKILLIPFILVAGFVGAFVWFYINAQPVSGVKTPQNFLIEKGTPASTIGTDLQKAGLIKSGLAFKLYTQITGTAGKMVPGEFNLTPNLNLFQMVSLILKGPTEVWVTIPEGLRREEVAVRFEKGLNRSSSFLTEFLDASNEFEGMLFPDTYLFPKDASASSVVNRMTRTFASKTNSLGVTSGLTYEQRIILASILERETKTDAERPVVAGILINRLNMGMPLQVDATVQYAVANTRCKNQIETCSWWEPVYSADLTVNSPFNTYKFAGLPPAPISNPGISSLKAAFNPTQNDYLYYIHDPSGQIHYAKTLTEQNANIQKYLR